jgi:hypothetical protein
MAQSFPAPQPWLHTCGNQIRTPDGEQVILRGANYMRSEWGLEIEWGRDKALPALAQNWHGNVVVRGFASRPVIDPAYTYTPNNPNWPNPPTITSAQYLRWLDQEQQAAADHGMYIVFSWRSHGINGPQPPKPDAEATTALVTLAQRYKNRPNVIFSLQVEPHDTDEDETTWEELLPLYNSMVTAIREATAPRRHLIMVPGANWSRDTSWAVTQPVTADGGINIIYKSHPYEKDIQLFRRDFMQTHEAGLPVFVGEFGVAQQMTLQHVDELLPLMQDNAISWAAWILDFDGDSTLLTNRNNLTPTIGYGEHVKNAM